MSPSNPEQLHLGKPCLHHLQPRVKFVERCFIPALYSLLILLIILSALSLFQPGTFLISAVAVSISDSIKAWGPESRILNRDSPPELDCLLRERGYLVSTRGSVTRQVPATTHVIAVGKGDHKFAPDTISAQPGDVITFEFFPLNHSVVQASFDDPCVPIGMVDSQFNNTGFWSGFYPVNQVLAQPPSYSITINDTKPLFFYCSAPQACTTWGMVGTINPTKEKSFAAFQKNAMQQNYSLSPGEPWPAESSSTSGEGNSVQEPPATKGAFLTVGQIVGIVFGALALMALIMACMVFLINRSRKPKTDETQQNEVGYWNFGDISPRSGSSSQQKKSFKSFIGPYSIRANSSSDPYPHHFHSVPESVMARENLIGASVTGTTPIEMRSSNATLGETAKGHGSASQSGVGEGGQLNIVEIYTPSNVEREEHRTNSLGHIATSNRGDESEAENVNV